MKNTTRKICATAMGIALFVVLTLCLQVPVFENYYLCLGYIAMMVFCYYFGTISGTTVGVLGVIIYCLLTSGLRGMPGWALANVVIGIMVGLACKLTKNTKKRFVRIAIIVSAVVISTALGVLVLKSFVEYLMYAQPMWVRMAKNVYAFVADIVVMIIAIPVCESLGGPIRKIFKDLVQ